MSTAHTSQVALAQHVLAQCRDAYLIHDYELCLFHASRMLSLSDSNPKLKAAALYYKGNIEEIRGLDGKALQSWATGINILGRARNSDSTIAAQLSLAIEGILSRPKVFLSYASRDENSVADIRRVLESDGVRCVDYTRDFDAGRDVNESIHRALWQASAIFVFWSSTYPTSRYCIAELESALRTTEAWRAQGIRQRLVVIRLDATELPAGLSRVIWLDLRDGLDRILQEKIVAAATAKEDL